MGDKILSPGKKRMSDNSVDIIFLMISSTCLFIWGTLAVFFSVTISVCLIIVAVILGISAVVKMMKE